MDSGEFHSFYPASPTHPPPLFQIPRFLPWVFAWLKRWTSVLSVLFPMPPKSMKVTCCVSWSSKDSFNSGLKFQLKIRGFQHTLLPRKLTWNLKMDPSKRRFLWKLSFSGSILVFRGVFLSKLAFWTCKLYTI